MSTTYVLDIINPCATSIITPPALITPPIYYILGANLNFVIPSFTQNLAHPTCSLFTYVLTKSDGTAIDTTIFTFTPATSNLFVSTVDPLKVGMYFFKITGYLL